MPLPKPNRFFKKLVPFISLLMLVLTVFSFNSFGQPYRPSSTATRSISTNDWCVYPKHLELCNALYKAKFSDVMDYFKFIGGLEITSKREMDSTLSDTVKYRYMLAENYVVCTGLNAYNVDMFLEPGNDLFVVVDIYSDNQDLYRTMLRDMKNYEYVNKEKLIYYIDYVPTPGVRKNGITVYFIPGETFHIRYTYLKL